MYSCGTLSVALRQHRLHTQRQPASDEPPWHQRLDERPVVVEDRRVWNVIRSERRPHREAVDLPCSNGPTLGLQPASPFMLVTSAENAGRVRVKSRRRRAFRAVLLHEAEHV